MKLRRRPLTKTGRLMAQVREVVHLHVPPEGADPACFREIVEAVQVRIEQSLLFPELSPELLRSLAKDMVRGEVAIDEDGLLHRVVGT